MLQGVNFLSGGQDDRKEKETGRTGTDSFGLSKPEIPKEDKKSVPPKKFKTVKRVLKEEKGGWWRKFFSKKSGTEKKKESLPKKKVLSVDRVGPKGPQDDDKSGRVEVGDSGFGLLVRGGVDKSVKKQRVVKKTGSLDASLGKKLSDFDINLMPSDKKGLRLGEKVIILVIVIIILVGGIMVVNRLLAGDNQQDQQRLQLLRGDAREMEREIDEIAGEADEALGWYEKVVVVKDLVYAHQWWLRFFTALETNTLLNVYYTSLSVTQDNRVVLEGVAKDYESLAQAILLYQDLGNFMQDYNVHKIGRSAEVGVKEGEEEKVNFILSFVVGQDFLVSKPAGKK